jgi:hypothetical protein
MVDSCQRQLARELDRDVTALPQELHHWHEQRIAYLREDLASLGAAPLPLD